ncbi:hypothetical protein FA15DRAFT_363960 [Coprinopsis marcescibilis]|uniref:C2 domain-containing protein n=1 Tax=Coprinopsis marcescibilis TaxID=230819 RepID=A0A5C3KYK6_COPMA|nr:hypothetical protein FA15DRAFT_363960 [Coprinopsis marcescibilis]
MASRPEDPLANASQTVKLGIDKMTRMFGSLNAVAQRRGSNIRSMARDKNLTSLAQNTREMGHEAPLLDLKIQFIGASDLPKMDVVGTADPYFVAKLDDKITFVSNVIPNTLSPVWNEGWRVRNVPSSAVLHVEVKDKDEGSTTDDSVGTFKAPVHPDGAREFAIEGSVLGIGRKRQRGTFWLKIESSPATMRQRFEFQYLFDGPIRFTRNFSPALGLFTRSSTVKTVEDPGDSGPGANPAAAAAAAVQDPRLYSTWKFHIKRVPLFFRDVHQPWNAKYAAAQKIFGNTPTSMAVRSTIQAAHSMLYARLANNGSGTFDTRNGVGDQPGLADEPISLKQLLHAGGAQNERIKPAVYTYIISSADDTLRFSETGAAFFVDFASKHALHSNCATQVRYSGEFHPRPVGGWGRFKEERSDEEVEWELVVDNNSGTYAPDKMMLPTVKECLEFNFGCDLPEVGMPVPVPNPGDGGTGNVKKSGTGRFRVVVYDREDERLVESREACREYAVKVRGVRKEELQPSVQAEGEVPLSHAANAPPFGHSQNQVQQIQLPIRLG